jgi:eukaryotic-like serine/threonine-protein kinase
VAHIVKEAPSVTAQRPDLPATLDAPIIHMLAKDPAARPSSVGAAWGELEQALRDAGIESSRGPLHLKRVSLPPPPEPPSISRSLSDFGTGAAASVRPSDLGSWLWLAGVALLVIAGASLYSLSRERSSGVDAVPTSAPSSAATGSVPQAATSELPAPTPSASVSPLPASTARASATPSSTPSPRAPSTPPRSKPAAKRSVPTDLENPF